MKRLTFNLITFGVALFVFLLLPVLLIAINRYNFYVVHTLNFLVSLALPVLIVLWTDRYEKINKWIAGLILLTDLVIFLGYFTQSMTGLTLVIVPFLSIILIVLGIIFRSQFYYAPRVGVFLAITYGISLIRYSFIYGLFAVVLQEGLVNSLLILSFVEIGVGILITLFKLLALDGIFEEKYGH